MKISESYTIAELKNKIQTHRERYSFNNILTNIITDTIFSSGNKNSIHGENPVYILLKYIEEEVNNNNYEMINFLKKPEYTRSVYDLICINENLEKISSKKIDLFTILTKMNFLHNISEDFPTFLNNQISQYQNNMWTDLFLYYNKNKNIEFLNTDYILEPYIHVYNRLIEKSLLQPYELTDFIFNNIDNIKKIDLFSYLNRFVSIQSIKDNSDKLIRIIPDDPLFIKKYINKDIIKTLHNINDNFYFIQNGTSLAGLNKIIKNNNDIDV